MDQPEVVAEEEQTAGPMRLEEKGGVLK